MLVFFTGVDHGGPARCEHQAQGVSCRCEIQDGSTHIFMFDCHVTRCCIRCPPKLSVLGPLLFNSYFNNLGQNIPNFVWSETKLTLCISRRRSLRSFPGSTTGICSTCVSACISCTLCTTSLHIDFMQTVHLWVYLCGYILLKTCNRCLRWIVTLCSTRLQPGITCRQAFEQFSYGFGGNLLWNLYLLPSLDQFPLVRLGIWFCMLLNVCLYVVWNTILLLSSAGLPLEIKWKLRSC